MSQLGPSSMIEIQSQLDRNPVPCRLPMRTWSGADAWIYSNRVLVIRNRRLYYNVVVLVIGRRLLGGVLVLAPSTLQTHKSRNPDVPRSPRKSFPNMTNLKKTPWFFCRANPHMTVIESHCLKYMALHVEMLQRDPTHNSLLFIMSISNHDSMLRAVSPNKISCALWSFPIYLL